MKFIFTVFILITGRDIKAKVKRIRIHDFRHSHATLLLSKSVPITVISKRLGHADMTMTLNVYSHLIPEDEDKAINIINEMNNNFKNTHSQGNIKRTEIVKIKKSLSNKDNSYKWSGKQDDLEYISRKITPPYCKPSLNIVSPRLPPYPSVPLSNKSKNKSSIIK